MRIAWRKLTIAGVAGFAGGKACSKLKEHPDTVIPILQASAATGVVGAVLGLAVSAYRSLPSHVYSLSVGANFAVVSGVFLGIRHGVLTSLTPSSSKQQSSHLQFDNSWSQSERAYVSSIVSGGLTGALTSTVSRYGLYSMLLTSLGGIGIGVCGQMGYNKFLKWKKRKAIELHYPELVEKDKWTFEKLESRFVGFWHKRLQSAEVEREIVTLEAAIAEEKTNIAQLDSMLRERGETVEEEEEEEAGEEMEEDSGGVKATL